MAISTLNSVTSYEQGCACKLRWCGVVVQRVVLYRPRMSAADAKQAGTTHQACRYSKLNCVRCIDVCCVQLSRFSMKNLLNAMTDLQRTQHMLLGTKTPYLNVRGGVRMQAFLGVFKRAAATATRRWASSTQ